MTSTIAIINARRVWRGGAAAMAEGKDAYSYPAGCDAVLIDGGTIAFVGSTNAVLERYATLRERVFAAQQRPHPDCSSAPPTASTPVAVHGGRPRQRFARIIDCQHKHTVLPGFIDSHVHLLDGGRRLSSPQLDMANSRASFVAILRTHMLRSAATTTMGEWLYGGGWSEAVLGELPTREWLDEVCGDVPTVLFSKDVHSCVTNTAVLRLSRLMPASASDSSAPLPVVHGGRIECDAHGVPTGVLRDNAIQLLRAYMPTSDTATSQRRALEAASEYFLSRGFTMVYSMMSMLYADNIHEVRFLQAMERSGELRLRVRYAVPASETMRLVTEVYTPLLADVGNNDNDDDGGDAAFLLPYRFTALPPRRGGGYCLLGAVKILGDGSLSSRTAAMTRPYGYDVVTDGDIDSETDKDGTATLAMTIARVRDAAAAATTASSLSSECQCGMLLMTPHDLCAAVELAHAHHLQCCVHAIGDRAVATTNKALAASGARLLVRSNACNDALVQTPPACTADAARWREHMAAFCANPRSRVEHCQHIANVAKELQRMHAYHIIASMQPNQLLFDGDYIDELLGSRRKTRAYLWRTLLKNGIRVALGSDWPVASADVDDGLRGAVTRVPDVMSSLAAAATTTTATTTTMTATATTAEAALHTHEHERDGTCAASDADCVACTGMQPSQRRYHAVWNADECLTVAEALCTYTYESAYAAFMEDYVGTIDVGKYADVTIWSDDHFDTTAQVPLGCSVDSAAGLHAARWWRPGDEPRVLYTIVGGNIEYEASPSSSTASV